VGRSTIALVAMVVSLAGFGCESLRLARRPAMEPRLGEFRSTYIDYVDTESFDLRFENSLLNRDAVITIRTPNDKPDWTGRLNAWIAAWNMGKGADLRRSRGQFPVPSIDGDTLREFRLLVDSVVNRAEDASKASVQWFRDEKKRSYRMELLKPYNLRFHMNTDGHIHVIFFHGAYANQYQEFVSNLTECDEAEPWTRTVCYSRCKKMAQIVRGGE
jgi:hypothetical protein